MTTALSFSSIRDNRKHGKVADFLKDKISSGSHLSIVSAYFTIYTYEALADQLNQIGSLCFLFGEPRFINSLDPSKTDSKSFKIEDQGLSLNKQLQQKEVARQCAAWIQDKVEIRSIRQANLFHGKLYHINDGQREHVIFGSSNFTQSGLGLATNSNIELNLIVDQERDQADLKVWFDELWNSPHGLDRLAALDGTMLADAANELANLIFAPHHPIQGMLSDLQKLEVVRMIEGRD